MSKELKYKSFQIKDIKEIEGRLTIEAYGAIFGNIDSYGDVIEKGAFAKTIEERGSRIAFCYQHDIYYPIGKITDIKEDEIGLWLRVEMSASEKDISTKIKEGILSELSIGYRTIESDRATRDGVEVNILKEIMLYEVSMVTIAANPLAVITGMKSEEKKNMLVGEIDRLLSIVSKRKEIEFELLKIKALAQALDVKTPEPLPKPQMSKEEARNILFS